MALSFTLTGFEGPLDLLLHLISKNKIDIYDIPIGDITDQYFEFIEELDTGNMEEASDFIVMAATLLEIKSRMLLPPEEKEEDEEDPRTELVERLLEYKRFKHYAGILQNCLEAAGETVARAEDLPKEVRRYKPPVDLDALLRGVTMDKLKEVFEEVLRRSKAKENPEAKHFGKIEKERILLPDCMRNIETSAIKKGRISFKAVLSEKPDREDIVVTFLALLELVALGRIIVSQEAEEEIYIEAVENDLSRAGDYGGDGEAFAY